MTKQDEMMLDDALFDGLQIIAAEITRLNDELEKYKSMPMKYKRMQFNAELQNDNVRLREAGKELAMCLSRYVKEVPLGHQPHMLAHVAEELIDKHGEKENG